MSDDEFKRFLKDVDETILGLAQDLDAAARNEPNEALKRAYLDRAERGRLLSDRFGEMIVQRSLGR